MIVNINYWAVLVSSIVGMIIGAVWYSPLLFGKAWMKLMNFDKKKLNETKKKGMGKSYLIMFIALLLMSYILADFVDYVGATTVRGALQLALWLWLGFFVTTMISSVLWEGKSTKLYLINVFHYLVVLGVMSIILSLWV